MGIHYVWGYTGYEATFLRTFIDLIDRFCSSCHTNNDVCGDCRKCHIGQLIYASKEYVMNAHESDILTRDRTILRKIKGELGPIIPCPHFNGNWIWDDHRNKDVLIGLREYLEDLEFVERNRMRAFNIGSEIRAETFKRIAHRVENEMKKIKGGTRDGKCKRETKRATGRAGRETKKR